ncbi:sigma-70 family RNA polymerase sigma factor [Chitinophagaceae bacterium LB-8]|uniref:Sigma-70 family RNA polymerase sigma factor n=1 Tax=Paraflavisolibacter caeni TaxID=2982496 RepID=A0A9X2XXY0_9BACT|nr:sigma-70 family RNA polymerase sigma factor [Paraflavisolibacter caeni]MCU7550816.1 sigma-70 family RNA polymerase sigma factor [Paraflavisolibacter caeni]
MPPSQNYTETSLIQGLLAHDEQAYSYLYDHYSKALFNIIYQIIPQQEVAEDVLQEVFIRLWQNITSYDASRGRLFTWMLNITRNLAIDRIRSKDYNKQTKTTELKEDVYEKRSEQAIINDIGLKNTMNQLPDENRKLLELAYFQGYTQEEISKLLNLPLGTVKTRIRSTLIQLRTLIGKNNS